MKGLITWLKASFEDDQGKSSYRRLSSFAFLLLIVYMVLCKIETEIHLRALYALLTTFLLLIGIVTVQNIITFWRGGKPDQKETENKEQV